MPGLLKKSGGSGKWAVKSAGSSRSNHLYQIKKEARKIREAHAAGKITAEEAARELRKLHSSSQSHFFWTARSRASA